MRGVNRLLEKSRKKSEFFRESSLHDQTKSGLRKTFAPPQRVRRKNGPGEVGGKSALCGFCEGNTDQKNLFRYSDIRNNAGRKVTGRLIGGVRSRFAEVR